MPTEARFSGGDSRGPYVREFYNITLDTSANTGVIEYNGYCYLKDNAFPVERWLTVFEEEFLECDPITDITDVSRNYIHQLHVRIIRKEELEDTSEYWDDPEEGMMCLFPTNRIRLYFEILPEQPSRLPDILTSNVDELKDDTTVEELE